jgi:hypothetical protein
MFSLQNHLTLEPLEKHQNTSRDKITFFSIQVKFTSKKIRLCSNFTGAKKAYQNFGKVS